MYVDIQSYIIFIRVKSNVMPQDYHIIFIFVNQNLVIEIFKVKYFYKHKVYMSSA